MNRNINLNRISDFLAIVEFGNITKAAESLGERKTKLSRNLAILEQELGVQLIYRTTRQLQLTEAGQKFYQESKTHLINLESTILNVLNQSEEIKGKIKLTAPEDLGNYILNPIISDFIRMHPKVEFELIYTNQILDLVKLGVDIAYRIGELKDSTLIHKKIGYVDFILAASPKYIDLHSSPKSPNDLILFETIDFSLAKSIWKLQSLNKKVTIKVNPTMRANTFTAVQELCILGHGIAFLPRFLAEPAIAKGHLVQVLRNWTYLGDPIQITIPNQKKIPQRIRSFFDFSAKRLNDFFN